MSRKHVLGALREIVLTALVLLVSAGRWDLPMLWAYFCVYVGSTLAIRFIIFRKYPDLYMERNWPRPGIQDWDRRLVKIHLSLRYPTWIIAGLDLGRLHWSDTIPFGAQMAGLMGLAASLALVVWAMATNPFYSRWIRIQRERGHRVVTTGPYQYVRHPGYLGNIVSWLCGGLALGSWLAMVPAAVSVALYLIRLTQEDRTLQQELTGYAAYAEKVRYRLLPGLW